MTADLSYQKDSPFEKGNVMQSSPRPNKCHQKVYQIVTDRIISNLEKVEIPWKRPWINNERPKNLITGKEYKDINLLLTSCQGFTTPLFLTFKQCKDLGGNVKKGEKGTPIVYWNWINKTVKDPDTDEDMEKSIPFLRYYTVFNLEQTEGLNISYNPVTFDFNPIEKAEQIIKNMPLCPLIKHSEQQAYYSPRLDYVICHGRIHSRCLKDIIRHYFMSYHIVLAMNQD